MATQIEQNIANNLKELRKTLNLKQSELGAMVSYSDKMISKWEKRVCVPDVNALVAIANACGVSVDDLTRPNAINKLSTTAAQQNLNEEKNKLAMLVLSVTAIFMAATIVFLSLLFLLQINYWLAFVWAVPPTACVIYSYNKRTTKNRVVNAFSFSLIIWCTLAAVFLQTLLSGYNVWMIFLLGIPLEAMNLVFFILKGKSTPRKK